MKTLKMKNLYLNIADNGKFTVTDECSNINIIDNNDVNFELNAVERNPKPSKESGYEIKAIENDNNSAVIRYVCKKYMLEVCVRLDFIPNSSVYTQTNTVKNIGEESVLLTSFSSFRTDAVANDDAAWYEHDLKIHICHNKWQGEGQWKTYTPSEIGLYPTTTHCWEAESCKINSIGSWSTANFYPLVMVEDRDNGRIWFAEIEGSHNWLIKLNSCGGYNEPNLVFEASCCDEACGGWHCELNPGEEYTAERAVCGVLKGGFEEAVSELTAFKRYDTVIKHKNEIPPVVFNDYMDCVWCNQAPEVVAPLVEKAAAAGCEIFCIDGGWSENQSGNDGIGDWIPKKELYEKTSLKELAGIIKAAGMIPGIWLELDACYDNSFGCTIDDAVLKRYGSPIGDGGNYFYNFCNPKVRKYLLGRINELYDMGFRYIKNDYNKSTGIGCTNTYEGNSPAEGLIRNNNAFLDFIDEIYIKFPDLIIENCSSGALRDDNKMLRHFALQSTSDQELYENNPSIVMGSLAIMAPEKAGIWSYPYPTNLDNYMDFKITEEYEKQMEDGKQTVFNMVTAMNGVLYLSGRIDLCDEKNFELIKEAVRHYKEIRHYIPESTAVYPLGMLGINEKKVSALGLLSKDKLLLTVWNLKDVSENAEIDLSKYIGENAKISFVYAASEKKVIVDRCRLKTVLDSKEAVYVGIELK